MWLLAPAVRDAVMLRGQRAIRAVIHRLPEPVADWLRAPPSADVTWPRRALLTVLRHGGIPRAVRTFRLADDLTCSFVNADSLVLSQLYWFGEQGWEPELLPWWRYLCRRSAVVLELGTNVGYYAVQGARAAPGVRYTAVEPHPASLLICRANLGLNGITSVDVVAAAAVADPGIGSVQLLVPHDQLTAPTVAFVGGDSELPPRMAGSAPAPIQVPAVDVRMLLAGVDLIKLDVEGHEHTLLAAAEDYLREHRPAVVVEVLPGTTRLRRLLAQLCCEVGYRCYVPQAGRLVQLVPSRLGEVMLLREYGVQDLVLSADPDLPLTVADLDVSGRRP